MTPQQRKALAELRRKVEADTEGRWNALGVLDAVEAILSSDDEDAGHV